MNFFEELLDDIGLPLAHDKTLGPMAHLEYLGLTLSFDKQTIGIPLDKRVKCHKLIQHLIQAHELKKKVTIKFMQKLAGALNFICQALPAGCPFLSSLYYLTRNRQGNRLKIGNHKWVLKEVALDMRMFQSFIDANAHECIQTVPFLHRLHIASDEIQLFANAAGAQDKGLGCCFGSQWYFGAWAETSFFKNGF